MEKSSTRLNTGLKEKDANTATASSILQTGKRMPAKSMVANTNTLANRLEHRATTFIISVLSTDYRNKSIMYMLIKAADAQNAPTIPTRRHQSNAARNG